jgi:hypothetical protein
MKNYKKTALEIYGLYHDANGSITGISSRLQRNDSSKLSRQINPNDDRRDNFYIELLEAHRAMAEFMPDLEEEIWKILERERSVFIGKASARRKKTAEHLYKLQTEIAEFNYKRDIGVPQEELEKECYDILPAAKALVEDICGSKEQTKDEIQQDYFPANGNGDGKGLVS